MPFISIERIELKFGNREEAEGSPKRSNFKSGANGEINSTEFSFATFLLRKKKSG